MIGKWFNEGTEAYGKGTLANACPYPMGSEQEGQWLAGWTKAHGLATTEQLSAINKLHDDDE